MVFEILDQNKFRRDKRRKRKEETGVNTLEMISVTLAFGDCVAVRSFIMRIEFPAPA